MGNFQSMADIRTDSFISGRVQSCILAQTNYKAASPFVDAIRLNPMYIAGIFIPMMSVDSILSDAYESGGNTAVTDQMILSGCQGNWDAAEKLWTSQQSSPPVP